jgi:hypothetical protein
VPKTALSSFELRDLPPTEATTERVALLGADPATAVALEPRNSPAPLISCCGSALPPLSRPKLCAHSDQAPGTASKSQAATRIGLRTISDVLNHAETARSNV